MQLFGESENAAELFGRGGTMKRSGVVVALSVLFLLASVALSAPFWQKKPYTEWSEKDCVKLLSNSPWAYPYATTGITLPGFMQTDGDIVGGTAVGSITGGVGDREVHIYLRFRFVTSRAVKAAIGQSRLLADPGNKELAQQVVNYVDQPSGDDVIVEVTYYSQPPGHPGLQTVQNFLRTSTIDTLKTKVWLSSSSSDAYDPIDRYVPPGPNQPGALLLFQRNDKSGKPYFDGSEKQILLHMETTSETVDLKMKPKDMQFEGAFTF
jgi:hypothetical protein